MIYEIKKIGREDGFVSTVNYYRDEKMAKGVCALLNEGAPHEVVFTYSEAPEIEELLDALSEGLIMMMDSPIDAVSIAIKNGKFEVSECSSAQEAKESFASIYLIENSRKQYRREIVVLVDDYNMRESDIREAIFERIEGGVFSKVYHFDLLELIIDIRYEQEENYEDEDYDWYE